uniref:Neur_chan_memb domain-containing protein n=1 Tax=Angiostrongylus cantonensis TaxID=6313 RepID=A0A0K0DEK4_ANGCA
MILSALATVICFQLEKSYSAHSNRTAPSSLPLSEVMSTSTELTTSTNELLHREDVENLLSTVTLIAAILFFFSFFMAMYAHVKVPVIVQIPPKATDHKIEDYPCSFFFKIAFFYGLSSSEKEE